MISADLSSLLQLNAVSRQGTLRASCKYLWAGLCGQVKRNRKNQPCHDRHSSHNGAQFKWLLRFAGGCFPLADHQGIDRLRQRLATMFAHSCATLNDLCQSQT